MGLFDNKKEISRGELRKALSRNPISVKGKKMSRSKRIALEKELFPPKYGSRISRKDYTSMLDDLGKSKFKGVRDEKTGEMRRKTTSERWGIDAKRRALRKLGGI